MILEQIRFDTQADPAPVDPLRMDVACFVGYLAQREPLAAGAELAGRWLRLGLLDAAEVAGGPRTLYDRPVLLRSVEDCEALFDGTRRLDQEAAITGAPLGPTFVPADVAEPFGLVIDGALREIDVSSAADTDELLALLSAAGTGLDFSILQTAGDRQLRVARPIAMGPGTLGVLAHPGLGFGFPRQVRSRAVGTVMDAALRQFFAMGGQAAHVVSLGPPLPLFAAREARSSALARLGGVGPVPRGHVAFALAQGLPAPHDDPARRSGITHLFGLEDAALLVLPDLPDLTAADRLPGVPDLPQPRPLAEFAECLPAVPEPPVAPVAAAPLPLLDAEGAADWRALVDRALRLIADYRRDMHLVAALPRTGAETDLAALLPRSAFLQLVAPFLRTPFSGLLPGRMMPADAALAGQLAALALGPAPHGSAALRPLSHAIDAERGGVPAGAPVIACRRTPQGLFLDRDITLSDDPAWRAGPASRLAARLFRLAETLGADLAFAPISDALMHRVTVAFTAALGRVAAQGGLNAGPGDAGFTVRCDRSLNRPEDLDRGILQAEVTFRPAAPIEEIRVVLPIGPLGGSGA